MRYKNVFFLAIIFVLLFSGCKYFDIPNLKLTNEEANKNDTVLNGLLPSSPLGVPKSVDYFASMDNKELSFNLTWKAVAYAVEYSIFMKEKEADDFVQVKKSNTNSAVITIDKSKVGNKETRYFKIHAINSNGVLSPASQTLVAKFDRVSAASLEVGTVFVSKGTQNGIDVSWIPVEGAAFYLIERAKTGGGDVITVKSHFINITENAPRVKWTDKTIETGVEYDYFVTPYDKYGSAGVPSSRAVGGFVYPSPQDLYVLRGSLCYGVDGGGNKYTTIDLRWKVKSKLLSQGGVTKPVSVDYWKIEVATTPAALHYIDIDDIFDINVAVSDDRVTVLKLFDPSLALIGSHLPETITTDPYFYIQDPERKQLFVRKNQIDPVTHISYNEYFYRLLLVDDNGAAFATGTAYYSLFYFKVQAIYRKGYYDEYSSLVSPVSRGFAADPEAFSFKDADFNIDLTATATPSVRILFNKMQKGTAEVKAYQLLRKESSAFNFVKITEIVANGSLGYNYEDISVEPGKNYDYAIAFIVPNTAATKDLKSRFSAHKSISIPAGGQ